MRIEITRSVGDPLTERKIDAYVAVALEAGRATVSRDEAQIQRMIEEVHAINAMTTHVELDQWIRERNAPPPLPKNPGHSTGSYENWLAYAGWMM